mgnify:FL=1|jgi:hypothetical protein|tara:strand:- start:1728 stop:2579 length:852 start_codon:yes stop_codon:yes gene_type:complete
MTDKVTRDGNKPMTDAQLKAVAIANINTTDTSSPTTTYPTEIVQLPSKGKLYPEGHPLKGGTIEMKYMTAKEEDILTNQSFISNGVVLDKLFQALIVTPCDYNDITLGDKNAIMIAARVLGYGKDYPITIKSPTSGDDIEHVVDLTKLDDQVINWSLHTGENSFKLDLPASKRTVTVSILTQRIQKKIDAELKGLAKLKRNASTTTMLKHLITSIDGETDNVVVRKFVENDLLAIDSRAIRTFIKSITPDIDLSIEIPDGESGDTFRSSLNIGLDFFWPDAEL